MGRCYNCGNKIERNQFVVYKKAVWCKKCYEERKLERERQREAAKKLEIAKEVTAAQEQDEAFMSNSSEE